MQHTLQFSFRSSLNRSLNLIVACTLLDTYGQIDDGDVGGWDTHRHASELAIEVWDNLADSLGGTSAAWNNVLGSGTSTTPVLCRWAVDGLLGSGVGVDGGHQTLNDGVLVVDDLSERGQAVFTKSQWSLRTF